MEQFVGDKSSTRPLHVPSDENGTYPMSVVGQITRWLMHCPSLVFCGFPRSKKKDGCSSWGYRISAPEDVALKKNAATNGEGTRQP